MKRDFLGYWYIKPKYSRSYNKDETYRLLCAYNGIGKPDLWNQESTNSVESDLDCASRSSLLLLFIYVNLDWLVRVSMSAHSSGIGYKGESVLTGSE